MVGGKCVLTEPTNYVCNFNSKCRASRPAERARGRGDLPANFRDVWIFVSEC